MNSKITPTKLIELLSKHDINEAGKKDILRIYTDQIRKETRYKIENTIQQKKEQTLASYQSYLIRLTNEAQELKYNLKDFIQLQKEIDQQAISKPEITFFQSLKELSTTIFQAVKTKENGNNSFHSGQDQQKVCLPPMR